jgi:hypothetical protein
MMNTYQSMKRNRVYKSKPLDQRFNEKVLKTDSCWLWKSTLNNKGYGMLFISKRPKYVIKTAHRVSWELHYGPIPDDLCVLHKCDTPACVNPEHLFLGTHKDNMVDAARKERIGGIKLTAAQVEEIRALGEQGLLHREIAAMYGVSRNNISQIIGMRSWDHG